MSADGLPRPAAYEWEPLGYYRDPVPGDHTAVKELAEHYAEVADAIKTSAKNLRELTQAEGWTGEAAKAFCEKADGVATLIDDAWGRYNEAAEALSKYQPQFQDAQSETYKLRKQAEDQQADLRAAQQKADASADPNADNHGQHDTHVQNVEDEKAALRGLHDQAEGHREAFHRAAGDAASRIENFISDDGLNDSWTDDFGGFLGALKNFLIKLGEIAGIVAAVCGILALAVGWIPVVGQALAGILGAVALIATCFSLIGNVLQGDMVGIALDIIGIATFGIGRALGASGRFASAAARADADGAVRLAMRTKFLGRADEYVPVHHIRKAIRLNAADDVVAASDDTGRYVPVTHIRKSMGLDSVDDVAPQGFLKRAFGGMGTEMRANVDTVLTRSNWSPKTWKASGLSDDTADLGIRSRANQLFGQQDSTTDLAQLRRIQTATDPQDLASSGADETMSKAFRRHNFQVGDQIVAMGTGILGGGDG